MTESTARSDRGLVARLTSALDAFIGRWLPEPLVIVLLLTVFVFLAGLAAGNGPVAMVEYFGNGFWDLLTFAMQMALVLVTGFVVASTPLFERAMSRLARVAKTPRQAILLVTAVSLAACLINWGFGLVIGALFAKRLAREVPDTDYRVLIAAGYSGFLVWHAGLSGSIPLTAATPGNFLEDEIGLIPTSETIFSPANLILLAVICAGLPFLNAAMLNHGGRIVRAGDVQLTEHDPEDPTSRREVMPRTPAARLEHARWLGWLAGGFGLSFLLLLALRGDFALTLNTVNFLFLFAALGLHGSARNFLIALDEAVKGVGGILIQFPFYAGVMGMMVGSGLAAGMTDLFVGGANATILPALAFLSAGFVNVLVPSGGGQWAVQGPIIMPAAETLGADPARVALAVAWGDAWTNMIQPFWALPALAVAGLSARDIMGFCMLVLMTSGAVLITGLTLLP